MATRASKPNGKKVESVGQVLSIPTELISAYQRQPRKEFGQVSLARLIASIEADGQQEPATVTPVYGPPPAPGIKYILKNGERRWRACKTLGRPLDCIVQPVKDDKEHWLDAAVANFHREPHSEIEHAHVIEHMLTEYKFSWEEITRKLGKSEVTLRKYYDLLQLAPTLQQKFGSSTNRADRLPIAVASDLSRLPKDEQLKIAPSLKGKRADEAREVIRRHYGLVEKAGGTVLRAVRGRQRRPSDDTDIVETRLERIIGDMDFITQQIGPDRLKAALAGRTLGNNARVLSMLGDISTKASTLSTVVKRAMPDSVKAKMV